MFSSYLSLSAWSSFVVIVSGTVAIALEMATQSRKRHRAQFRRLKNFVQSNTEWEKEDLPKKIADEFQQIARSNENTTAKEGPAKLSVASPQLNEDLEKFTVLTTIDKKFLSIASTALQANLEKLRIDTKSSELLLVTLNRWLVAESSQRGAWILSSSVNPLVLNLPEIPPPPAVMGKNEEREYRKQREVVSRKLTKVIENVELEHSAKK